ncbi:hypothetical protein ATANTOWER_000620 [Ataeniobius toweri]|uniref:Uncharacterized protein n=1 Tax=Ataeniobius toweri TaxID=208326 RepID=A0ABU7CHR7_9TELE|nr:hypothetical protein [Ataeniobius toweri]
MKRWGRHAAQVARVRTRIRDTCVKDWSLCIWAAYTPHAVPRVCRICKATLTDIIRHFDENGARPRLRKKSQRPQDLHFKKCKPSRGEEDCAIKKQQDHLQLVQKERAVYNEMTAASKKTCDNYQLSIDPSPPSTLMPKDLVWS